MPDGTLFGLADLLNYEVRHGLITELQPPWD